MNDKRYQGRGGQHAKGGSHPRSTSSARENSDFFRFDARIQAPDFVLSDLEEEQELQYESLDEGELTYEDDGDFLDHAGVQPQQPEPKVTRKTYNRSQPKNRTVRRTRPATPSYRKPTESRRTVDWQEDDQFFDEDEYDAYDAEPTFGSVEVFEADDGYLYEDEYDEVYEAAYQPYPNRSFRPSIGQPQPRQLIFVMVGIILVAFLLMSRPLTSSFMDAMARSQSASRTASVSQAADTVQPQVEDSNSRPALWGGLKSSQLAPFFSQSVLYWENDIIAWAERHNLDPNMVATVMQIESCGDPRALSSAGAMGLFQVMPFHFQAGEDGYNPDTNALRGMNYLAERLIQTNGEIGHAFAGYNGGQAAAASNWNSWAHETQRYYKWTTGVYSDALNGNRRSTTLDEWLVAGGASLCIQAEQRLGLN